MHNGELVKSILLAVLISIPILGVPRTEDESSKMQRVHVLVKDDVIGVFVPAGKLVLIFDKGNFVQKEQKGSGGLASPRYFYFEDTNKGTILSGWFEPASRFKGVEEDWAANVKQWQGKPELEPHQITTISESKWNGIMYHTKHPGGVRVHIKAHWVEADTWIDVHLSEAAIGGSEKAEEALKKLLKSTAVKIVGK